ncbi:phage repressor protein, partial [Acinetobacter baumannii]
MKNLETMGQRIRALRREKKLTQGELAKIVGVSAP